MATREEQSGAKNPKVGTREEQSGNKVGPRIPKWEQSGNKNPRVTLTEACCEFLLVETNFYLHTQREQQNFREALFLNFAV